MLAPVMAALRKGAKTFGIGVKSKFTWKIPNFSQLSEKKILSEIFIVGDCKWRLIIYPKGKNNNDLSIYLDVADSKDLPDGWNRDVKFSFSVASKTSETQHVLSAESNNWGFPSFIPLSELKDPDTLTVVAKVHVLGVVHSSKDSKKDVHTTSKLLLAELSSIGDKQNHFTLDSVQAPEAVKFQQHKELALQIFFNMSFEAIHQADDFVKIEESLKALGKNTNNVKEKTALEDIISRLADVKSRVHSAKETAETAKARRASLAGKTIDIDSKLEQRKKELSSLESEFSRISGEEAKLQAEIDKLAVEKKLVSVKLERANEETCKEIEERKSLEAETKKVNAEWVGAKEKLAAAKGHWDLLRADLGLAKLH